jgi:hypothetical protein
MHSTLGSEFLPSDAYKYRQLAAVPKNWTI